jgi:hypothetical protein
MVRFQADADLNQIIVAAVVRKDPAVDFRTATVAALEGMSDLQVLALAAAEGRVLVTHDAKTMPRHFAEFVRSHDSAGVVVVPQHLPVSTVVEEVLLIAAATSAEVRQDALPRRAPFSRADTAPIAPLTGSAKTSEIRSPGTRLKWRASRPSSSHIQDGS